MVTVTAKNTPETKKLNYIDINKKYIYLKYGFLE